MNETMNILLKRRAIRKFKPEQIKDEELNAVIEAGRYAPSARNVQSTIFIAVQNKELLKKLSKINAAIMGTDSDPFYGAPTVILVLGERDKVLPIENASLALGNMFNAAYSLGLGSCWVNRVKEMFETEEGKALLKEWGIQGNYIGVGSCILGYPDCELPEAALRRENVYIIK